MKNTEKAYLELHVAVLLFGFTAILGHLIQLSAIVMVWWRVLITCISLFFLIKWGKKLFQMEPKLLRQYAGIGVIIGIHWICFFGAIKYSNASIALVCMATTAFFTSIIEPIAFRTSFKWFELGLGLLIVPGMALIVNNIEWHMMNGIYVGLLAAFLAAIFATLNKKLVNKAGALEITFIELGSACLFISCLFPFYFISNPEALFWPSIADLGYLLILALLCTTLAYVLALRSLRHLTAFSANLTINLEPVYGILLAWFILHDNQELSNGFYWGSSLIIFSIVCYPYLKKRFAK